MDGQERRPGRRSASTSAVARCASPGCGRFVAAGQRFCARHRSDLPSAAPERVGSLAALLASGPDSPDGPDGLSDQEVQERHERAEQARLERARRAQRFRERLEAGNYRALFDDYLARVIAQAAAERGVLEEIGALRLVLARLLVEEDDLTKLAANVARVASVAVQAARAQRAIDGEVAQSLTAALTQILIEMDQA